MPRFHFRMTTLLRIRESLRDQRRAELAEALRVDEVLRDAQRQLESELTWLRRQSRQAAGPGVVHVDQLLEAQRYEVALRAREQTLARQRAAVAEEIERRRALLVEADRDVKTLEKLRERKSEEHRLAEARAEIKVLDEVAQLRAAREEVRV